MMPSILTTDPTPTNRRSLIGTAQHVTTDLVGRYLECYDLVGQTSFNKLTALPRETAQ